MKRVTTIIIALITTLTTMAADTPNAFRLSLKEGKGDAVEIAFIANPIVTYKDNGNLVITIDGETTEYQLSDIAKMTFFYSDNVTSILNAYDDVPVTNRRGIYTIDGKRTDNIKTKGLYIINGRKVVVR